MPLILLYFLLLFTLQSPAYSQENVVNIYGWGGEIPDVVVREFEKETGITVNLTTYENNETMYAKLSAVKNAGYDLVMPTSYFVDRMYHQQMLEKIDKTKLTHWKNINPAFLHLNYDPNNDYSIPNLWGITGLFLNDQYYSPQHIKRWSNLWDDENNNQLLLLDDARANFAMALISLGYSLNDQDPQHIHQAFLKLKTLMKNVKVFSTDSAASIITDEDATIGLALNGDTFKASRENPHVRFVFPEEGFGIWVDNFSIPKNAPHKEAAYAFLNFMLRADIGKEVALFSHFATANLAAQKILPPEIRNNPIIYPSKEILAHGQFQTNVNDDTLSLYEKYWEELKMNVY